MTNDKGKHTPGPWEVSKNGVYVVSRFAHFNICRIKSELHDDSITEISTANARLIAAAPDLLAALRDMLNNFGGNDNETPFIVQARAAIAKAEGKEL